MENIPRTYDDQLQQELFENRQMVFLSGPRQSGKTTIARALSDKYLDWDNQNHQQLILKGPDAVAEDCGLLELRERPLVLAFDELHKYPHWKNFLKGFFDTYEKRCRIIVTGSARLDVYRRGGDSLMGRYFPYRLHPLSLGELQGNRPQPNLISPPRPFDEQGWERLIQHGGFPEPFSRNSISFTRRWLKTRNEQLIKEDLRDLTRVNETTLLGLLANILAERSGEQMIFSNLANQLQVSSHTIKSWVNILVSTYYGFLVRPWYKNINKSLRKEPKWFLRDWSGVSDEGKRSETIIACHLLKAVELWTDLGYGEFELRYLRDKQKREVDFLVIRDDVPWFLVEAKKSNRTLSPNLSHFQKQTKAAHAFQCVLDAPYVNADCFSTGIPTVVPAKTFLSQLV